MIRAFIVARPADYWLAEAAKKHMISRGWHAKIMLDAAEWDHPPELDILASYATKLGMYGNDCATGILDGIIGNSEPGDRVLKMDCDVWIDEEISDWFRHGEKAKCAMLTTRRMPLAWGGIWSADHDHVVEARGIVHAKCPCPESVLNLRSLNMTRGLEIHSTITVHEWENDGVRKGITTIPVIRKVGRVHSGKTLFGIDVGN